ncbi:MAG: outer membrane protein transport protein, partial [Marinomonas sp.]|uniref:OmpP1/FadL family transporter n=1 Tax=Marinomonas sp. TaxID=1904862 RepID=UPI003C79378F
LGDQSATASGSALSTAAASSEDISFSYWNPALFLNAKKNTFYVSGAYIMPKMDVSNIEANNASAAGGASISGSSTNTDSVDNTIVPSLYYAMPLSDDTVAGFSINAPFGLSGDYGDDWAGRFHATETGLQDIALSFSLAHQVNDWFSAGASVQVHKAEVTLKSAVGISGTEGTGDIEADDIGYGYSLGVLFTPVKGTRIGVGYRSKIDFDFEGDVKYKNITPVLALNPNLVNADVSDSLTFPDILTISLEQALTPKLKLGLSVIRTGWSSMDDGLNIDFDSNQSNSELTFGFEDQWMYSAGLTYDYSKKLTLRTGIARDNSPVTDEYRSARTPDGDRTWYSMGGTYHFSETSSATFAYTYVDIEDVSVDRTDLDEDSARGAYSADYSSSASVISLAYNMSF